MSTEMTTVPQWPTITANVESDGTGELNLGPSSKQRIAEQSVEDARAVVLQHVAAYANENHHRAVRLRVQDPEGEWVLGVNPDGTGFALEDDPETDGAADGTVPAAPPPSNGVPPTDPAGRQRMRAVPGDRETRARQPQRWRATGRQIGAGGAGAARSIRCLARWIEKRCTQDRRAVSHG